MDGDGRSETTVYSSGEVDVTVPGPGTHRLTAIGTADERDRIPAVYAFEDVFQDVLDVIGAFGDQ